MAKKANPKLIGGFVVGAVALAVIGVIAFGGGEALTTKERAVLHFTASSLSGLDAGSPVTFRGIKVGSVTDIIIRFDVATKTLQIPVYIEIEPNKFQIVGQRDIRNIQALVQRGLRAQLVTQSLVTGQASVDFDFHPDTPVALVGADEGIIELPTIPSDIDMLKANIASVLQKVSALPLDQVVLQVLETMKSANQFAVNLNTQMESRSNDLKSVSEQTVLTLKEAQARLELRDGEPLQNLNKALTPLALGADKIVKTTLTTLEQAQRTLQTAQSTISPDSQLYFQLTRSLLEIQSTASSIRVLAEYMQRNPNAVLTGKRLP
jgi:paraquat-inducible protein B